MIKVYLINLTKDISGLLDHSNWYIILSLIILDLILDHSFLSFRHYFLHTNVCFNIIIIIIKEVLAALSRAEKYTKANLFILATKPHFFICRFHDKGHIWYLWYLGSTFLDRLHRCYFNNTYSMRDVCLLLLHFFSHLMGAPPPSFNNCVVKS